MDISYWFKKNCKFAGWYGPLPKGHYSLERGNPYADLLVMAEVKFDPAQSVLTIVFDRKNFVKLPLTPEQNEMLSQRLEIDLRKEYLEVGLHDRLENVVKQIMTGQPPGWGFDYDDDGIIIYDANDRTVRKISRQELAQQFGIVMPKHVDDPQPQIKGYAPEPEA